jgi:hypothetical protein
VHPAEPPLARLGAAGLKSGPQARHFGRTHADERTCPMEPGTEAPKGKINDELPAGYRQGIITANSIFISFSLLFFKYWSLEAPGDWTIASACAAGMMLCAIALEIVTLWRALQIKDSALVEYNRTLKWLMASIVVMITGLLLSGASTNISIR